MQILALEQAKELRPLDSQRDAAVLAEEAAAVWALQQRGTLRAIWFTQPDRRAVLLLECADAAEASAVLARLPLARDGFIAFDCLPLTAYDGFARLFASRAEPRY